ncbi:DUF2273 domain-containing protein [Microbacterium enclense]|uniref:DUF2273 domain-containing protein n=1 Tax=Microbacterium enclense TaxID=993073 RepID=A0A443JMV5_9MICO|nr:DUF2273 domain-containing protein [Microbacterium enclense]MCT2086691.1 DUF2273 domain-containing protein [Microbacterium enclense]RWR21845.1 DUF2273 domain-containing protein [Microbacterium enclense]
MNPTITGALVGLILAAAALIFGFWGFLLVALFMAIGAVVGRIVSGQIDIRSIANAFSGRSTS